MTEEQYQFTTLKDRLFIHGGMVAGALTLGGAALVLFNPVVLGLAAGYSAWKLVRGQKLMEQEIINACQPGRISLLYSFLPPTAPIRKHVRDIGSRLGGDVPAVMRMSTFGLPGNAGASLFAANLSLNTIMTTQEALDKPTDAQTRYIVAHEMIHLKGKTAEVLLYCKLFCSIMFPALAIVALGAVALSLVGVSLPLFAAGAGTVGALQAFGGLLAAGAAQFLFFQFGLRAEERRADRGALYITRDLAAATSALEMLTDEKSKNLSPLFTPLSTHPRYKKRIEGLKKAFEFVAKYPELSAVPHGKAAVTPAN